LPQVCAQCGAKATTFTHHTFSTGLGGLPFLPLPVITIIAGKLRVRLPFCEAHKHHWRWRTIILLGGSFLVACLVFGSCAAFLQVVEANNHTLAGRIAVAGAPLALVSSLTWLGVCFAIHRKSIRLVSYDRRRVYLEGVAPEFVEAAEEFDAED
jgi:hypothetical protein